MAVAAVPIALPILGFGAGGVAAGSVAAAAQATIGNVVAGSLFASLQSAGVLGLSGMANAVLATGGAAAGYAINTWDCPHSQASA